MSWCFLSRLSAGYSIFVLKRRNTFSLDRCNYHIKSGLVNFLNKRNIHFLTTESIPHVSETYVKNCLSRLNILYEDGFTCINLPCPKCKAADSLYVNKISGFSICNSCKKSGDWKSLEAYLFKTDKKVIPIHDDAVMQDGFEQWETISKHLYSVTSLSETKVSSILESCNIKAVKLPLLKYLNVRMDIKNNEIYIPLRNGQYIVGYKKVSLVEELTYPIQDARGIVIVKRSVESAVIVQNIKDFFALSKTEITESIICLPHGEQSLPQAVLPLFESYKKVILWFGNDAHSWDTVRIFAKKLFEQRCHLVRPMENQPAAHLALERGLNLSKIISSAQPVSHASITTFSQLREDVLSELQNIDKVSGIKWKRFLSLNSLLKGHRRGELTVLTGPTGSGKTTFMSEYSLDLASQGVTTLWGSFEIRNQRLARMMLQQFVLEPLEENLDSFNFWADAFQRLPLYFMTFHGQQSLQLVMEAVEHASYVHDISHVVIDNVQFMLGLSNTETGFLDRFYRQDALIAAFRNFATIYNVHVTLVIHPRKEKEGEQLTTNSIFGGAKASQEADNVLIIQQRTLQSLKTKKFLQVAKNRYSGDVGIMPLEFNKSTLSFAHKKLKDN